MSAELLREAAAKMRERANNTLSQPPWRLRLYNDDWQVASDQDVVVYGVLSDSDAEHIASWHPGVALAVADWLDAAAEDEQWFARHRHSTFGYTGENPAFAVARAYLGRQP